MQFLSIFNKYKVLAAQYLGDAMGHFPFRYTFIFVVRYQFQFAINLRHQCRLVPALMGRGLVGARLRVRGNSSVGARLRGMAVQGQG